MRKKLFDDAVLDTLRSMPATKTLDVLGFYWKQDPDFHPTKDKSTIRIHVTVGSQVHELLISKLKFFDPRTTKGGGGAIDLVMHLLHVDFVSAVKKLASSLDRYQSQNL